MLNPTRHGAVAALVDARPGASRRASR